MPSVYESLTGLVDPAAGPAPERHFRQHRKWMSSRAQRLAQYSARINARLANPEPGDEGVKLEGDPVNITNKPRRRGLGGRGRGQPGRPVETADRWFTSIKTYADSEGIWHSSARRRLSVGRDVRFSDHMTLADWEAARQKPQQVAPEAR